MKRAFRILVTCILCTSIYIGCQTTNSNNDVSISGTVIDAQSGAPIKEAIVEITSPEEFSGTAKVTDENGSFKFDLTVSESPTLLILVRKSGYEEGSINVPVSGGLDIQLDQPIRLAINDAMGVVPSQPAARIFLESVEQTILYITGTGGVDNSELIFQVQDSSGNNLDLSNSIEVNFSILVGPDGGEGLLPESAMTNSEGRVTTSLFSGTKAGVVQVQAEIVRDDLTPTLTIRSQPIPVTIHGGFPDEDHFSLAPAKYNFEGYTINGTTNEITAIIGDEFSNPVKPGTAVYFSSTGGIIEGSGTGNTNDQGFVNVELISGDPRPDDTETVNGTPFTNVGLATITASTVDKDNNSISKSINVVFSTSAAIISANPTTFDLESNGGETFNYTVTDLNGNPMAAGTTIVIDAGDLEVSGDGNITLGNHIFAGPGATEFTFSIRDTDPESNDPAPLSIKITVTSPSGNVTSLTPITGTRRLF